MNPPQTVSKRDRILGGLWGSLVGDALGVPVEFKDRPAVQADPVKDMRGYGTHHQPPGTWSDDGALILCTVDSLVNHKFDTTDMGRRFVQWMNESLWTATGDVFDIGLATTEALMRISNGTLAEQAGGRGEFSNGNGSLMRILPVILRFENAPLDQHANLVERASSITHGHSRSKLACVLYGLITRQLLLDLKPQEALDVARVQFAGWGDRRVDFPHFRRVMQDHFPGVQEDVVASTGYVLHTLHASLWCLLTTNTFEECVLKAVNLGGDTDTTGCVAGGLAGVHYGIGAIPEKWIRTLARHDEVALLFNRFAELIPFP